MRVLYRGAVNSSLPRVRRAPNVVNFLVTGALLGLVVGLALATFGRSSREFGALSVLGLFGVAGAGAGLLLGGAVAMLFEQRSLKRDK